ncbi:MAG: GtrA family protein [Burkholderiaceae bacterium]
MAIVRAGLAPLLANPLGWLGAFGLSWAGHQHWTFADAQAPTRRSLPRFAAISFTGFAVNEAAYAMLLHGTALRYDVALGLVLVAVAVLTWIASRLWAFTGTAPPPPADSDPGATGPRLS